MSRFQKKYVIVCRGKNFDSLPEVDATLTFAIHGLREDPLECHG